MRYGFSLVELSIVLVILGLLTGGILSGQSLIRAAELRSVTTDATRYMTAVHTFRDRYMAIPGDMPNAVKFWGAQTGGANDGPDSACAALMLSTPSTDTRTCNGNGDGQIGAGAAQYYELPRFWQHLANAGLIEGNYTGVSASDTNTRSFRPRENVPAGKIANSMFTTDIYIASASAASTELFAGVYGNRLNLSAYRSGNSDGDEVVLTPENAWNIDTKIDDGRPGTGRVRAPKASFRANCASNDDTTTAIYMVSESSTTCYLMMTPGF